MIPPAGLRCASDARAPPVPAPEDRQRDAERTRGALLDAALAEFAAKGRAGARVSEIAERAGVNKQLISYYFGGKDGLYEAIARALVRAGGAARRAGHQPRGARRAATSGRAHVQPDLQRLFIREDLDQDTGDAAFEPDGAEVADIRARQAAGEFADELDPAFLLLMLQGMVVAHTVFRSDARRLPASTRPPPSTSMPPRTSSAASSSTSGPEDPAARCRTGTSRRAGGAPRCAA